MEAKSVVVCTWSEGQGELPVGAEEALTLGRKVAGALGSRLRLLVLGPLPEAGLETAGRFGADDVDQIDDPALEVFSPDVYVEALALYCEQESPSLVIFSQSADTRVVAPRLAGRRGAGVVMNGVDIALGSDGQLEATASAYGGDTRVVYQLSGAPSYVVALAANALLPEPADGGPTHPECRSITTELSGVEERVRVVEQARTEGPRLEDADIIVSGGRGLGGPENYKLIEQLAEALGGRQPAHGRLLGCQDHRRHQP